MKKINILFSFISLFFIYSCVQKEERITILHPKNTNESNQLRTGLDVLIEDYPNLLKSKSIGIITNETGVSNENVQNVEILIDDGNIQIRKIFTLNTRYKKKLDTKVSTKFKRSSQKQPEIISLEQEKAINAKSLENLDYLIYDVQGLGSRVDTAIKALNMVLNASAKSEIDLIILDRPNPLGGEILEGPIADTSYSSNFRIYPIPTRYGLTTAELSLMAVKEKWLSMIPKIIIILMDGWTRDMYFDDTGLMWNISHPNIPNLETAILHTGMSIYESTNISEGKGTKKPFKQFGAPWMNYDIAKELKGIDIPGSEVKYAKFKPRSRLNDSKEDKFNKKLCLGFQTIITDKYKYRSLNMAIHSIYINFGFYPDNIRFERAKMKEYFGNDDLFKLVTGKLYNSKNKKVKVPSGLIKMIEQDCEQFKTTSKPYLLY